MQLKVAFDTNVFVYAAGIGSSELDREKSHTARALILANSGAGHDLHVAAQVLVELHDVLVRKGGYDRNEAATEIIHWQNDLTLIPTDETVIEQATVLSTRHKLRIFDAVILAGASVAGCDVLYSEDLQHGFVWRGVEVVNPFL